MHDITLKITKKKTRKLVILMEGDNEETVIAPGKTKPAAQNKPQPHKPIGELKSLLGSCSSGQPVHHPHRQTQPGLALRAGSAKPVPVPCEAPGTRRTRPGPRGRSRGGGRRAEGGGSGPAAAAGPGRAPCGAGRADTTDPPRGSAPRPAGPDGLGRLRVGTRGQRSGGSGGILTPKRDVTQVPGPSRRAGGFGAVAWPTRGIAVCGARAGGPEPGGLSPEGRAGRGGRFSAWGSPRWRMRPSTARALGRARRGSRGFIPCPEAALGAVGTWARLRLSSHPSAHPWGSAGRCVSPRSRGHAGAAPRRETRGAVWIPNLPSAAG